MTAVLTNLLKSSLASPVIPAVMVRYLAVLGALAVVSWPISDVVGRSGAPSAFAILVYAQVVAVPFIVNSFITGRFDLTERISIEDWVNYTPVHPCAIALAHAVWGGLLGLLAVLAALPINLALMPLAGDGIRVLGSFAAATVALSVMAAAFGYVVTAAVTSDWVTSAAADAGYGMWTLMGMDELLEYVPAKAFALSALPDMLSPTKTAKAVLLMHPGVPWVVIAPLGATAVLVLLGWFTGSAIRMQGRSWYDAGR